MKIESRAQTVEPLHEAQVVFHSTFWIVVLNLRLHMVLFRGIKILLSCSLLSPIEFLSHGRESAYVLQCFGFNQVHEHSFHFKLNEIRSKHKVIVQHLFMLPDK